MDETKLQSKTSPQREQERDDKCQDQQTEEPREVRNPSGGLPHKSEILKARWGNKKFP